MSPKIIAVGLVLLRFFWLYSAFVSYARGKTGVCIDQGAAAAAFAGRGIFEWVTASRS